LLSGVLPWLLLWGLALDHAGRRFRYTRQRNLAGQRFLLKDLLL